MNLEHQAIESLKLGKHEGFDIVAYALPDYDSRPSDFDCYTPKQITAWRNDQWQFVGVVITASRHGIQLGEDSLWGIEYGYLPITNEDDEIVKPEAYLDLKKFYETKDLEDLMTCAIDNARTTLEALTAPDNESENTNA